MFASMVKNKVYMYLNICSRHKKQSTFIGRIRDKFCVTVVELEDGSNKYYVTSQADYEAAVKSLVYPQGFAEYEGKRGSRRQ